MKGLISVRAIKAKSFQIMLRECSSWVSWYDAAQISSWHQPETYLLGYF